MKHVSTSIHTSLRLLALSALVACSVAHADEYADVTQLMRSGKLTEAMTKADQYLAGKPRDPQMRFLKGVIQRDSGQSPEAIATFSKLTEDYPELPEPYNNLAVLYASQSQFDKARTALEMAIRTNPSYATAHENLGDVYAKLASQAYNKALQLDSTNQAVPPKLALIRELFSANSVKGPRSAATLAPPVQTAVTQAATSTTTPAIKPPLVLPPTTTTRPATSTPSATVQAAPVPPAPAPATAASTPAANPANPATKPPAAAGNAAASKDVEAAVLAWANAWSAKDVKGYLAAYGKDFDTPGAMKRAAWEDERRARINGKSKISVKLEGLDVSVNGNKAVAKFRQNYKADGLDVSSRKTLDLVKNGDRWQIVRESTGS